MNKAPHSDYVINFRSIEVLNWRLIVLQLGKFIHAEFVSTGVIWIFSELLCFLHLKFSVCFMSGGRSLFFKFLCFDC